MTIIDGTSNNANTITMNSSSGRQELSPFASSSLEATTTGQQQQLLLPFPVVLALSVPAALIILLTVFGNMLVLLFKARVGRTNTTLLVWNLGLTDFMVGILVLPMGAFYLLNRRWVFGHLLCRIWVGADVTFCTCSVVTICIISVDRYLAVTRPLRYKSVVTKCKVVTVIILIWTFSLGILLATVRWESQRKTTMDDDDTTCYVGDEIRYLAHSVVFAFFLPASVTLTLYWRIYSLARNRQRALDRGFLMILGHNMNFLTNTLSQTTALRVHIGKNNGMVEHQRRVLRTHERIAKTLGVVSCSFLFCWLPFFTLYLLNHQCSSCVPSLAIDIASWLGYCNSMLNPIIYSFTVKEFKRSAFRAVLPMWRYVHGWCPRLIRKPPDARSTHRIARKRQQQVSATPQQQHRQRPPPPPPPVALCSADGPKRRLPCREHLSRARTGAIASLMVNTNCSIMQNAMTAELVTVNNTNANKSIAAVIKEDDDGDQRKSYDEEEDEPAANSDHQQRWQHNSEERSSSSLLSATKHHKNYNKIMNGRLVEEGSGARPTTAEASGGEQHQRQQPKRSMVMLGENWGKMAQLHRLTLVGAAADGGGRRQSSLDDDLLLWDAARVSSRAGGDSGQLFSRSGMVTTTLLLATSESICSGAGGHEHHSHSCHEHQQHRHDQQRHGLVMITKSSNKNSSRRRCARTAAATSTSTTVEERVGSLPTTSAAGSFSSAASSLDSDLTAASHSKRSVRMPCKFPVKKLKGSKSQRRHSLPGIPTSSAGNINNDDKPSTTAEGRKSATKSGKWLRLRRRRQRHNDDGENPITRGDTEGGTKQQQQPHNSGRSSRRALLFAAFKRGGTATATAKNERRIEEGGEGSSTTNVAASDGLWGRAKSVAPWRRQQRQAQQVPAVMEGGERLQKDGRDRGGKEMTTETRDGETTMTTAGRTSEGERVTSSERQWCQQKGGEEGREEVEEKNGESGDGKEKGKCDSDSGSNQIEEGERQKKRDPPTAKILVMADTTTTTINAEGNKNASQQKTVQIFCVTDETPL